MSQNPPGPRRAHISSKQRPDVKRLPWPKHRIPRPPADPLPDHIKARFLPDAKARPVNRPPSNPTIMDKPFWKYMIAKGDWSYGANKMLDINPFRDGPTWCFDRFGRTTTWLPDGRVVLIAGEHEDSYDPDFCIYNDVVVIQPREKVELVTRYLELRDGKPNGIAFPDLEGMDEEDGDEWIEVKRWEMKEAPRPDEITIYGYPEGVFPPTDGHVAVYVRAEGEEGKESIYIVGGVGYPDSVHRKMTCVFRLDLANFSIGHVPCTGELPPHEYDAVRARRARLVGREIVTSELNGEKYSLNLETSVWKKLPEDSESELEAEDAENQHMQEARPVSEDTEKGYL
ncbi:hypothetical protein OQA88_10271 [Cercophora sp. LCS_1]